MAVGAEKAAGRQVSEDSDPGSWSPPVTLPPPTVSIIIPTWNRASMLRLTLATVLAQHFADFEVLVIGDGCTDDSAAVVASFGDPRLLWRNLPTNSGGPSIPNNVGSDLARGRFVAHLGHDDFWLPWHLSGLLEMIDAAGADWAYPLVVAIGPDGIRHCTGPPQPGVPDAEHHVPPSGWLYRREIAKRVGRWSDPADLAWPVDFDYMRRAALAGTRFAFHPRPTALKFPSSLFPQGYRSGEPDPIQADYFARLRDAPATLEAEILRELATRFAQHDRGAGKGIFDRRRPDLAPGDGPAASAGAARQQFQDRRLGRRYLRGLAADVVDEAPIVTADLAGGDLSPADGIRDRLATRSARRDRREQKRQRNAHIKARRERSSTRAARDEA